VEDVTLSLPHLVGGSGVLNVLQVPLNNDENSQLQNSARIIKDAIQELNP
jgi:malate/lactate dehydrogenase